ncbi:Thiolase, N-terminal domain-containing protein [Lentinula aff. detonsa]|uniref:Thiolase, N-terminal domain-containing protein n=1 Tax=Lentinula aff. detonsa TaxID=2804958 RepID=A0AA38L6P3_9AGAR|nr:Thiolase, N-terminal domain-containing protein [Lentinula aff. detonsa]
MLSRNFLSLSRSVRAMSTQVPRGLAALLEKKPDDVVITFAKRTATGRAKKGQLKDVPVDEMLYHLFKATISGAKIDPAKVDDICVGTCHPPSPLYLSRAAALAAGFPHTVPISTVNRLCSSGLMSIRNIAQGIKSGEITLGIAAGTDSMSLNPRPTPETSAIVDENAEAHDCVQPMGWTSEMVAEVYKVPREKQDYYALISHTRASEASAKGIFAEEIVPITVRGTTISVDDTIRPGVTAEGLAGLKSAFPQWSPGTTTAGNASGVGDGAAVCVLTSRANAEKEGMEIIGKYVASTVVSVEPKVMGISPVVAIPKVLEMTGLTKEDIDVYEINEAFASQFAYCVEELGIPIEKINPNGGAIAISHPLGMTGTRQVVTGLAELKRKNKRLLVTSMCVGSGMGAAGVFVNEARHEANL